MNIKENPIIIIKLFSRITLAPLPQLLDDLFVNLTHVQLGYGGTEVISAKKYANN